MPASSPKTALALSFCALALYGATAPAYAQAGDSASSRAYAATASVSGPTLAIGARPVPLNQARLQVASGPTVDCDATGCATLRNAKATTPTRAGTNGPITASLTPTGLTEVLPSVRGESANLTSEITQTEGHANIGSTANDIVLDSQTMRALDQDVQDALADDLNKLASMLEPLATAAGPGALADVLAVVRDIAKDPGSRPFIRVFQAETATSVDAKPAATVVSGPAQILVFPTANDQALIRLDLEESTLSAESPVGASASGVITPGKMNVVLLPGLAASLPAAVGANTELAGTPVAQVLNQLPKAASGILGPNFAATDSALVLDEASGGLKMEVSTSTDRACWFDSSVLETCVESAVGQRNVSANGAGVGVIAQPARLGMLRQNLILSLHEARIGVNADQQAKTSPQANPHDHTQPLPRTGSSLPPVWVMVLTALASIGVLTVVRPRR